MRKIVLIGFVVLSITALGGPSIPPEQQKTMDWFEGAKFGLFIHWGVYSMYEGYYQGLISPSYAEWIALNAKIPIADYRKMGKTFNPVKYDPKAWAKLAKDSGMKYLVITTKHHEGYALFDTRVSNWSVMNSTYGKDLIGPLAKACKQEGIRFGAYYSHSLDWVNGGQPRKNHWDKKSLPGYDFDDYLKRISLPQVKELLEQYPEIDILWWDMPKEMTPQRTKPFNELLEKYPHIIQNPRLGKGGHKNYETFEQSIPSLPRTNTYWESCMTMNHTWGYRRGDDDWKSTETLIQNLIGVVAKGGNYLLNIGPKPDGTIPEASIQRLHEMGAWLKDNGEAIYGTTHTPFTFQQPWKGSCTQKADANGTTLYLHVFDWPKDGILPVLGLENDVDEARLLVSGQILPCKKTAKGIELEVPNVAPNPYSSTVVLHVSDPLKIHKVAGLLGANGATFAASDAKADSRSVKFVDRLNMVMEWKPEQAVEWEFDVVEPGRYWVRTSTCAPLESRVKISCGKQSITAILPDTGSWKPFDKIFETYTVGTLDLKEGTYSLKVEPESPSEWNGLSLHAVELVPVEMLMQDQDGNIHLPIYAASFGGKDLVLAWDGVRNWSIPSQGLGWELMITKQSDVFEVVAQYAAEQDVVLHFNVNGKTHRLLAPSTGGKNRYLRKNIGRIPVTSSGKNKIKIKTTGSIRLADLKLWTRQSFGEASDIIDGFPFARANHYLKMRGVAADTCHPKKLLDGDLETYMSPDVGKMRDEPLLIEIDLGEVQTIKGIKILVGQNPLKAVTLRAIIDGEPKELVTEPAKLGWTELSCKSTETRIVQVEVQTKNPYFKIFELEIMD